MNIDEAVYAALREPRRRQMDYWTRAFEEHRRHDSFRIQGWAYSREVGFSCGCEGCEDVEWRLNLTTLRDMIPEVRDRYTRLHNAAMNAAGFGKRGRREEHRANVKAKALLHSQLTKEQRWDLRATKSFTITGRDGRTYRITEGSASNVQLMEDGVPVRNLCVVARDLRLPTYDLMLAQKLLLETAPEDFHKLAVVTELPRRAPVATSEPVGRTVNITDEDLDDPAEWSRQQLDEFAAVG